MHYVLNSRLKTIIAALFLLLVASEISAQSIKQYRILDPLTVGQDFNTGKQYGFLLLRIDAESVVPSLEISKSSLLSSARKVVFEDSHNQYVLVQLREDEYQIINVNAPYFDLPYSLDTSNDPRWKFKIKAGTVNYLGVLRIDKLRTQSSIDISLLKHVAHDFNTIKEKFTHLFSRYPLVHLPGYRDDFFEEFSREVN